ncbi:MAG: VWA domain-containing protein [Bryobacteraceae bacterium]|jgi:VWFA-related protein
MNPAFVGLLVPLFLLIAAPAQQPPPTQQPASAQQEDKPEQAEAPIHVEVNVVNVFFTVRDKQGGLVGNLTKDDFTIFEDGKQQTVRYFTRETDLPFTMGLLIDVSPSQENLVDIEKDAASQFFGSVLRPKDMAFLISFGGDADLLQDYTNSPKLLRAGLNGLHVNASMSGLEPGPVPTIYHPKGTILYDAVYLASHDELHGQVGRKALILITDGEDEGSTYKIQDAIEQAQKADAIIYSIAYVDYNFYRQHGAFYGGSSALSRMSSETGGRVFTVDRKHPLTEAFAEIQNEMRTQYAIGYTPANTARDGSYRKIEIRCGNKDQKVQARKGYYATPNSEAE